MLFLAIVTGVSLHCSRVVPWLEGGFLEMYIAIAVYSLNFSRQTVVFQKTFSSYSFYIDNCMVETNGKRVLASLFFGFANTNQPYYLIKFYSHCYTLRVFHLPLMINSPGFELFQKYILTFCTHNENREIFILFSTERRFSVLWLSNCHKVTVICVEKKWDTRIHVHILNAKRNLFSL